MKSMVFETFHRDFSWLQNNCYTSWSETDITYLFLFASTRIFHQYSKFIFKTFNEMEQTEYLIRT